MIFVILGTQDKLFPRLLKEIDKQIEKGNIKDEVIVQAGNTKYKSKNMKIFDFISMNDFNEYIKKSDFIITHGGVGSILNSLKNNKKVIAVPRLYKYKEHENDHQLQIINKFANEGYILGCNKVNDLEKKLKELHNFIPKKYVGSNELIINTIENFLEKK